MSQRILFPGFQFLQMAFPARTKICPCQIILRTHKSTSLGKAVTAGSGMTGHTAPALFRGNVVLGVVVVKPVEKDKLLAEIEKLGLLTKSR